MVYKIYTRILEEKFRKELEGKSEDEQAAFIEKTGTTDNIYIFRSIIERNNEIGEDL